MLHVFGVRVARIDAHTLVDLLLRVGRADDLTAAAAIEKGIRDDLKLVALTPAERDAVLSVLDDAPPELAELRGALARDQQDRDRS